VVRAATADDLEAIASLYAHYVETSTVTFDLEAPGLDAWRSRLRAAAAAGHPWRVAEVGGAFAGYATASAFRPKQAYRSTVETTIYLDPAVHGRGLGRLLYAGLLDACRAAGFHLAVVLITLPNPASIALHEGLGFTAAGVLEDVGHKLGAWRDVGLWQCPLTPR
jgi:L-amino acid N-acyltransferase YncA